MGSITINTTTIKNTISSLENKKNYYSNKKSTFLSDTYNASSNLASYLNKIQEIYKEISNNINNLTEYLKDYIEDIEGIEKFSSGKIGNIKTENIFKIVNEYKNTIENAEMNEGQMFEIQEVVVDTRSFTEKAVDTVKTGLATYTACFLSLWEGIYNSIETIGDGVLMVGVGAESLMAKGADLIGLEIIAEGLRKDADETAKIVEFDISKTAFDSVANFLHLDEYVDLDGGLVKFASTVGNITGVVAISIATGGLAAEAFGAGTVAATTATSIFRMATGALSGMGSEGEIALQRGATTGEASGVSLVAGIGSAVSYYFAGKLDAAARGIGAAEGSKALGNIFGKALGALSIQVAEPIANEVAHTAIYRNNREFVNEEGELLTGGAKFWENFKINSLEDGLIFKVGMAGAAGFAGTFGNGWAGIKQYNNLSKQISMAMGQEGTCVINLKHSSDLSESLINQIDNPNKVIFKIGDDFYTLKNGALELTTSPSRIDSGTIDFETTITEELPVVKDFNDEEIELKRREYDYLLSNNEQLKEIIEQEQLGKEVYVPANLRETYMRIKTLQAELSVNAGTMSKEELNILRNLENSTRTAASLKNDILIKIGDHTDPIEKARILYMELNKRVHYDITYVKSSELVRETIYSQSLDFENLGDNNSVICKGWSELYRDLLISAGFEPDQVKIMGQNKVGYHKWIEINLGDSIIVADATEAIRGSIDLASAKAGFQSQGFMWLDKSWSGLRLSRAYKNNLFSQANLNASSTWLHKLDQSLGYASDTGYLADQIKASRDLFADVDLVNRLFKRDPGADAIKSILNMDMPEGIDGYEAYSYFKKVFRNLDLPVDLDGYYRRVDGAVEAMTCVRYKELGTSKFCFFSTSLGKKFFDSAEELSQFLDGLDMVY